MLIKIENGSPIGTPISNEAFCRLFPDTSFPEQLKPSDVESIGYGIYSVRPQPLLAIYEKAVEIAPVKNGQGVWEQTWEIVPMLPSEVAAVNEQIKNSIVRQTQNRLDDFAKTRNYDGILSLCTYATSTNAKFRAEGQYGVEARDATWAKLYEILAEVEAGTRPMPTGFQDIEPELPILEWPNN